MKNRSVLILWVLVLGSVFYEGESVLKTTFIEDLCYNTHKSIIDLRYESSGILMSVPQLEPNDNFDCEVTLMPPRGAAVVLSIYRYDLYQNDLLTIEDSDRHMIALMGWGNFKNEKKSIISDGKMAIRYKTGNKTSVHRRAGFQFTFTKVMNSPCSANEFKCDNGKCILKDYVCDGHNHCGDSSDQKKCEPNKSRPLIDEEEIHISRTPLLGPILLIVAGVILFIFITLFIVYAVKYAKLKKVIDQKPVNPGNVIPLQSVSSPVPHSAPSNLQVAPGPAPTNSQAAVRPVPIHETQGNSLYNRVRRSLRGSMAHSQVEGIPKEQPRQESYQVPSMYPSLDHASYAPGMDGFENTDFRIEE